MKHLKQFEGFFDHIGHSVKVIGQTIGNTIDNISGREDKWLYDTNTKKLTPHTNVSVVSKDGNIIIIENLRLYKRYNRFFDINKFIDDIGHIDKDICVASVRFIVDTNEIYIYFKDRYEKSSPSDVLDFYIDKIRDYLKLKRNYKYNIKWIDKFKGEVYTLISIKKQVD